MDGENPKGLLIDLIVEQSSKRGPADRMLATLAAGGEAAVETLSAVLDHALNVLEKVSISSPRKSRKVILELMESVEEAAERLDADGCAGMSRCSSNRLEALVS
eukprot:COSAG04_NODE_24237_length_324_cov_2.048889_1_plen_103_part_10